MNPESRPAQDLIFHLVWDEVLLKATVAIAVPSSGKGRRYEEGISNLGPCIIGSHNKSPSEDETYDAASV
jgi:hypothetical protein